MEAQVEFTYGDLRIDKLAKEFYQTIVEKASICIRAIAGCRKKEVSFHRLIKNKKFTAEKMIQETVNSTQSIIKEEDHILCIQDTTEICFDEGPKKGKGGLGNLTSQFCKGLLMHPGLLVNAQDYSVLGLSDVLIWSRKDGPKNSPDSTDWQKRQRLRTLPIEDKESDKWLKLAENTKSHFSHAKQITIIADRESDIYEEWDRIPSQNVHLITRCCQNRNLSNKEKLFEKLEKENPQFCYTIELPPITGKRIKRQAQIEVSVTEVEILKPEKCSDKKAKKSIFLNAILVKEVTNNINESERVLWRLLTTHNVDDANNVRQIIIWYTKRWLIEQLFRTLKTQGINLESSQIENATSLTKLSIAGLIAALKTMQLVQAREGLNNRKINDVFQEEDFELLKNLSKKLEGKTEKQKNPHKEESLAWGSWVIARLGGWMGYSCERPPGPITMKRGLETFQKIKIGWSLKIP